MMNAEWIKVFSTTQMYEANVTEALLKENNIDCFVMNKQDSAYVMIGEIQIYTKKKDVELANSIIREALEEE